MSVYLIGIILFGTLPCYFSYLTAIKLYNGLSKLTLDYLPPAHGLLLDENHREIILVPAILCLLKDVDDASLEGDVQSQPPENEFAPGARFAAGTGQEFNEC